MNGQTISVVYWPNNHFRRCDLHNGNREKNGNRKCHILREKPKSIIKEYYKHYARENVTEDIRIADGFTIGGDANVGLTTKKKKNR